MEPGESQDKLILGVDFGTTYSGIAYSYSARPDKADDIQVVTTWPGGNQTSGKVPSQIAYGPTQAVSRSSSTSSTRGATRPQVSGETSRPSERPLNDIFNYTPPTWTPNENVSQDLVRWGYQLRAEETRLRCMKLLLQEGLQIPSYVSKTNLLKQMQRYGKDPETAVADYLTELYKHAKERIVKRFGAYFVQNTRLEVILTVPAIWTDAAKEKTLQAAKKAGMGPNITMISEPEAAAVYTIQATSPNHLRVGDNFVVCDAGGGTVDLISYEIKGLKPLRIEETVRGTGACCGSVFLDINFEEYVRSKMGDQKFRTMCETEPRGWAAALRYFEEFVKRDYDPSDPQEYNIPFTGVDDCVEAGLRRGYMTLSSETVGGFFEPILTQIDRLVDEQVQSLRALKKPINSIVLVGGFGQSKCLYARLKNRFASMDQPPPYSDYSEKAEKAPRSDQRFEILQPDNAWTAVARGAVLRGLEGAEIVLSRKSRCHYGTTKFVAYNPTLHDYRDRVWNEFEQRWVVYHRMEWFIVKGETCSSTNPILIPFYQNFASGTGGRQTQTQKLIVSNATTAPGTDLTEQTQTLCKLTVDVTNVPHLFWKSKINAKGVEYKVLDFVLGMQIESGGLRFDFRVDDVVYGDVVAEFHSA